MKTVEYIEIDADEFTQVERTAAFDGINDYLSRGAGLTGASDSKLVTFSTWLYPDVENLGVGDQWIFEDSGGAGEDNRCVLLTSGQIEFTFANAAGTTILRVVSTAPLRFNRWHNILLSCDLSDVTKRWLVINDEVDTTAAWDTYTDDTIDFTKTNFSIGAETSASNKLMGRLGDFWFEDGLYIDFSKEPNRRKFISNRLGPVDLGSNGENPTGSDPIIFLSGAYTSWQTNLGTGGGFTENGELGFGGYIWEVYRFSVPTMYLNPAIPHIPSIKGFTHTPAQISLGKDLGVRATVSVNLTDHPHRFGVDSYDEGSFWGKWRGRYGTKLRNRELRLVRGVESQDRASMTVRYFVIDTTDGPTPQGMYTIIAKDHLKLADDDRSQAPRLSNGRLQSAIDADDGGLTLTPGGIGDAEYPASGYVCIGGKEVVSFTRSGDSLTISRAQLGSVAQTHNTGDRVQLCLYYSGDDVADIIYGLMTNYVTGITPDMIDLAEWQVETAQYLGVIYNTIITEPTGVRKLLNELIDQAALAVFWDDEARKVRLKVLREIATDVELFDEDRIVEGSLGVKELPQSRISQIWTFYGQRDPTDQGDDRDNYRAALADADLVRETEYGAPAITSVTARWIGTNNAAQRHNGIKLSRFRDPPRGFSFKLWRDAEISPAQGYLLRWWANQNALGQIQDAPIQVTSVKYDSDFIYVTAEEMLASGIILLTHTIFLRTTGSLLNWTVPANWNDAENEFNVIGGGGGGRDGGATGGTGGGGGAFSRVVNVATLNPGDLVPYRVGIGGPGGIGSIDGGNGGNGGDTWIGNASFGSSFCAAQGGKGAFGGSTGGQASGGIGSIRTSGGNGAPGGNKDDNETGAGGAGGAGGPNGNGANGGTVGTDARCGGGGGGADGGGPGTNASGHSTVGEGGNNRFGYGGGNASQPSGREGGGGRGGLRYSYGGNPGGAGEQMWTQTVAPVIPAGPGGGGGGAADNAGTGGPGGFYGGGGGGARSGNGGSGAQGIIVITYKEP